jgi:hypothetical protein
VYLVQAGRPVGGRLVASDSERLPIHHLVDEARNVLVQDLMYSGGLSRLGFTRGSGIDSPEPAASVAEHYESDGLRAVLFFSTRPVTLSEIDVLDWIPHLSNAERAAAARDQGPDEAAH